MTADSTPACPAGCPVHVWRGRLWAVVGWLAAAAAAVSVAALPLDVGESLCGMWGCYPPLPPLLAVHLLWAVGLAATVWTVARVSRAAVRPVGVALVLGFGAAAAVVVGRDVLEWVDWAPAEDCHLWPLRLVHAVATRTDLPFAQGLLVGAVAMVVGRRRLTPASTCPRTHPATCPTLGR